MNSITLLLFGIGGLVCLGLLALWGWTLVHALRNQTLRDTERIFWVLLILVVPGLGMLLYFLITDRARARSKLDCFDAQKTAI